MTQLAKFDDRKAMERASQLFVAALRGKPVPVENVAEPRLSCGHEARHAHNGDCRICDPATYADFRRQQRVPAMVEATRRKLEMLEAEAKRRGQMV